MSIGLESTNPLPDCAPKLRIDLRGKVDLNSRIRCNILRILDLQHLYFSYLAAVDVSKLFFEGFSFSTHGKCQPVGFILYIVIGTDHLMYHGTGFQENIQPRYGSSLTRFQSEAPDRLVFSTRSNDKFPCRPCSDAAAFRLGHRPRATGTGAISFLAAVAATEAGICGRWCECYHMVCQSEVDTCAHEVLYWLLQFPTLKYQQTHHRLGVSCYTTGARPD